MANPGPYGKIAIKTDRENNCDYQKEHALLEAFA